MQSYSQKSTDSSAPIIPIAQKKTLTRQENEKYYEEFKKLLQGSFCLRKQLQYQISIKKKQLIEKLEEIEIKMPESTKKTNETQENNSHNSKPKRIRRTNNMLDKTFCCPFEKCDKIYASEGSLQQHLKLKHSRIQDVKKVQNLEGVELNEKENTIPRNKNNL